MTSINAIRFNRFSGAMIFDEMRSWNPQDMIIPSAEKMKSIVEPEITRQIGLVAGYGNTGTSSIGDELRQTIRRRISQRWQKTLSAQGPQPRSFMTIEAIAHLAYETICEVKHKHTNEMLLGKYGFNTDDFIQGSYIAQNGEKREIKEEKIIEEVEKAITWKDADLAATPVFLNAGIICGYEPGEGFRLFHLSLMAQFCEPVQQIFITDGSGRDQCEPVFSDFASSQGLFANKDDIPPAEGILTALEAIVSASRINIGVGGYTYIILFDGQKAVEERMKAILDDRAKLASEIVKAKRGGFITHQQALQCLENLCFEEQSWEAVNATLQQNVQDTQGLRRYLRGYGYRE